MFGTHAHSSTLVARKGDEIPDNFMMLITAHAAIGGVLTMVLMPLGAIAGRYLRTVHPKWVRLHYGIMLFLAVPMVIACFVLGMQARVPLPDWTDPHFKIGAVLLALIIAQAAFGSYLHWLGGKIPITGGGSILRYAHPIIGILIIILGFVQVKLGFTEWTLNVGLYPNGAKIAWAVLVAFWSVVYLVGFVLLPRQWRARKAMHNNGGDRIGLKQTNGRGINSGSDVRV